jgi:uncharacterized protein
MPTDIGPIPGNERVRYMDALRGFAILGIFIANLGSGFSFWNAASAPPSGPMLTSFDRPMLFLHHWFVDGKFYTLFSLLFGWGIALQVGRLQAKGIEGVALIRRRLTIMAALGLCHIILLWPGDIVLFYALLGFILLRMRRMSDRAMLITGALLVLSPVFLYFLKMNFLWLNAPAGILMDAGTRLGKTFFGRPVFYSDPAFVDVIRNGNYADLLKLNSTGLFYRFGYLFFVSRVPKVLGLFLIGYVIGRNGRYRTLLQNTAFLRRVMAVGLLIGVPANYMLARFMENEGDYFALKTGGLYQTIWYAIGVVPLGLSYAAALALASRTALLSKLVSVFEPVGRMAFTNYIFQSLVGVLTFYGLGFGVFDQMGPVYFTVFAGVVFTVQIILSQLWLGYFRYGPLEWLWRSATYGKRQAVKKEAPRPSP